MVPVGGGSGASGACIVAKAVRPSIEVIGVQSEAAPAAYRSWRAGALVEDTTSTFAEGLATRTAFELPQQIMRDLLDDFVLVTEATLRDATRLMIEKTRNLVEPAGAAALAAVLTDPGRFAGRNVALICSRRQHQPGPARRAPSLSGSARGPRIWPADQVTAAGSARVNSGIRSSQTSSATRSSIRARCEPRQRWMPRPNAACRFISRSMTTSPARSNCAGSRLAAGNDSRIQSSAFMSTPCQCMSCLTSRAMVTGA